ncbi:uncharacterized protein N7482_002622 [Penicillium canariense]|uniref:Uncharacterized protein n=1 Tax=Penicillium canariense TaxID=189055 RepID=A0A9W9IGF1_9EURO|nr:uncharacterized protein N7482_002622 [Penicillium canariense]KAJ5176745.1 hypothetical protein N7482_002622 [Penicillium canariense]
MRRRPCVPAGGKEETGQVLRGVNRTTSPSSRPHQSASRRWSPMAASGLVYSADPNTLADLFPATWISQLGQAGGFPWLDRPVGWGERAPLPILAGRLRVNGHSHPINPQVTPKCPQSSTAPSLHGPDARMLASANLHGALQIFPDGPFQSLRQFGNSITLGTPRRRDLSPGPSRWHASV